VHGDLDWIVMKALDKDRGRRHDTADGFAQDIERHLHHEPVRARPPSTAYRVQKFVRRNRIAVSVGAVVGAAVALGAVLAVIGFITARQERNRALDAEQRARTSATQAEAEAGKAEAESAISKAVLEFLQKDLLGQASPNRNPDRDLKLREALNRAAETVGTRFTNQPLVEATIRRTLGTTYRALGEAKLAEDQLRRAIELRHRIAGTNDHEAFHWQGHLALAVMDQGGSSPSRVAEAERLLQALLEECAREKHPGSDAATLVHNFAIAADANGRSVQAAETLERLLSAQRKWTNVNEQRLIPSRDALAALHFKLGRWWDAEREQRAMLELERGTHGPEHPGTLISMNNLACTLDSLGRTEEALAMLSQSQPTRRRVLGAQHPDTITSLKNMAGLYGNLAQWPECHRQYRELMEQFRADLDDAHLAVTAACLAGETNWARECLNVLEQEIAKISTSNPQAGRLLACAALATPEAATDLEPVFKAAEAAYHDQPTIPINILFQGEAEYRRGRWAEALRWLDPLRAHHQRLLAVEAGLFAAMTRHQLGQGNEARAALDTASRQFDAYLRPGQFGTLLDRADRWHDIGRLALLRAEAEQLIHGRTVAPPLDATYAAQARQRWAPVRQAMISAFQLAGQQKWTDARDAWIEAIRDPAFAWDTAFEYKDVLALEIGMTFLRAQDRPNHAQLCRSLFAHAAGTGDPVSRFSAAIVALLDAQATDLRQPATEATAAAKQENVDPDLAPWLGFAAGLANYRTGDYVRAIAAFDDCEPSNQAWCKGPALAYRALALNKLARADEARQSLNHARELLKEPLNHRALDWRHWAVLEMAQWALDEAIAALPLQK